MAAAVGLLALGPFDLGGESLAEAKGKGKASGSGGGRKAGVFEFGCRVQAPQKFLERRSFLKRGVLDTGKQSAAVRYLAERYGHVETESTMRHNTKAARSSAKTVRFMGLPVSVNARIAPALACVEKKIEQSCKGSAHYAPKALGGFRFANTYRGVEVSNHLFGIAIDIDPDKNPCCGCVDPWPSNPVCKNEGDVFERTALSKCWVRSFERFGFDWLGHDTLEDTMHFEFLGDPARIKK